MYGSRLSISIEKEIIVHLKLFRLPMVSTTYEFLDRLLRSKDIGFYWCIVTADFDVEDIDVHTDLLRLLVELYITMREFSYASTWLEHYKQEKEEYTTI